MGADVSLVYDPSDLSSVADDASSAASNALSKITDRSAAWDAKVVILKPHGEASVVATGDDLMRFTVPAALNGMDLVSVGAHVYTSATSNVIHVDVYNYTTASDMLTSAMQIDVNEYDTSTASSAAVIDTGEDDVSTGQEIGIDVTSGASGASGLEVRLTFK